MDISVVIPLYNEDESIPELYAWIERVMKEKGFSYEVIFINDGSTDRTGEILSGLKKEFPQVKIVTTTAQTIIFFIKALQYF